MAKGELKKYRLKGSTRPSHSPLLSTTVAVLRKAQVRGYCYVTFDESLVAHAGRKLPRGLLQEDPAFLLVIEEETCWEVYAQYFLDGECVLMWRTEDTTPPPWLKFHKLKVQNGNRKTGKAK